MLRKLMLAVFVLTFAGGAAFAQETCETKAVGKGLNVMEDIPVEDVVIKSIRRVEK